MSWKTSQKNSFENLNLIKQQAGGSVVLEMSRCILCRDRPENGVLSDDDQEKSRDG
jgi:hypothetical protein